eukprot:gene57981-biopygen101386
MWSSFYIGICVVAVPADSTPDVPSMAPRSTELCFPHALASAPAAGPWAAACPQGHALAPFTTPHAHYWCSLCRGRPGAGSRMWGCRPCNHDSPNEGVEMILSAKYFSSSGRGRGAAPPASVDVLHGADGLSWVRVAIPVDADAMDGVDVPPPHTRACAGVNGFLVGVVLPPPHTHHT